MKLINKFAYQIRLWRTQIPGKLSLNVVDQTAEKSSSTNETRTLAYFLLLFLFVDILFELLFRTLPRLLFAINRRKREEGVGINPVVAGG